VSSAALRVAEAPAALPDLDAVLPGLTAAFAATAAVHDREASFPSANFEALREAGLLALTAPAAWAVWKPTCPPP
jgi:alkylation response protein AidB-like acyl-CoA dehydrogenase